jgi:adenosine deaminase CECR1
MFTIVKSFFDYLPTYRAYYRQLLQELYDDNVMYAELRTGMGDVMDENGKILNHEQVAEELSNLVEDFKKEHPLFVGLKIIIAIHRNSDAVALNTKTKRFLILQEKFPNLVVGFDLVGQEDLGRPLSAYKDRLADLAQNGRFFLHAGETNFFNTDADSNLIDAILMNAKRIGHGFSLYKHPVLWESFKQKDIALEISPISNQVLRLVNDLRNHPASFYISENIPIVICNDDPGFWGAKGLSYDFYYALMALSPANSGLQVLKQLAWNSIKYSAMSQSEKSSAAVIFKESWDKFIEDLLLTENMY